MRHILKAGHFVWSAGLPGKVLFQHDSFGETLNSILAHMARSVKCIQTFQTFSAKNQIQCFIESFPRSGFLKGRIIYIDMYMYMYIYINDIYICTCYMCECFLEVSCVSDELFELQENLPWKYLTSVKKRRYFKQIVRSNKKHVRVPNTRVMILPTQTMHNYFSGKSIQQSLKICIVSHNVRYLYLHLPFKQKSHHSCR